MSEPEKNEETEEEEGFSSPVSLDDFVKSLLGAEEERLKQEEINRIQTQMMASAIMKRSGAHGVVIPSRIIREEKQRSKK